MTEERDDQEGRCRERHKTNTPPQRAAVCGEMSGFSGAIPVGLLIGGLVHALRAELNEGTLGCGGGTDATRAGPRIAIRSSDGGRDGARIRSEHPRELDDVAEAAHAIALEAPRDDVLEALRQIGPSFAQVRDRPVHDALDQLAERRRRGTAPCR